MSLWWQYNDKFFIRHIKDNIWICPIWSNDTSIPEYGDGESFGDYKFRLGIVEINDPKEQEKLMKAIEGGYVKHLEKANRF